MMYTLYSMEWKQWRTVIDVPEKRGAHPRRGIAGFGIDPDEYEKIEASDIPMDGGTWNENIKLFVYPTGSKNGPDIVKKAQELGFRDHGTVYTRRGKLLRYSRPKI